MNGYTPSKKFASALRNLVLVAVLTLAGCASGPKVVAPPPAASSAQTVDTIAALLNQGDADSARKLIKSALKRDPDNASLALLRDSVTRNPVELLGPKSFEYIVKPGDTLAGLAERYLGNRLMTYQLARYNGIDNPTHIVAGQTLRIPGAAPQAARRAAPVAAPSAPASPTPRPQPARPPVATPFPTARTNPAAARQLRTQGLAALNRGAAPRAVELLRRATALDPGNAAIRTDLARAERIAATVRSRR